MSGLDDLFGNIVTGPWSQQQASWNAAASQNYGYGHNPLQGSLQAYAALPCVPVPEPESVKQGEIESKNRSNYAHWLARITRDPLTDCEAK